MRYRAIVEYDGCAYNGFQRQLGQPTIQGAVEQALQNVSGRQVTIAGAGRTDSGVHALGQVIAFDLDWRHGPEALGRAVNANLPADIAVHELIIAEDGFHPRFSAKKRRYAYHIYNKQVRSPLERFRSWHVARPLSLVHMNVAARKLLGSRDFATFGQPPQGQVTTRRVFVAEWQRQGPIMVFTIEANAFLYRMVRSLVGSMKLVGEGAWTVDAFAEALEARDRGRAGQSAPAHGLYLVSIIYD